ncbi:unnamed protein product [Linum tenue]|uniref:DNA-binding protein RHL1 n=1 Tax=Linum tenue TaxID=586396 RepID=A0AAV0IS32_9ROSI|nr:unnamed protein product [Linum tenue]
MVRASKKASAEQSQNPEALERKRLKKLAFSNNQLAATPANNYAPLAPAKTVAKHHGKDILRKSQRKNRFLFSFPGLMAPITGGKVGELKDLGTKNPILYLDFPQGRMKLFGTIIYPKNRYLTLQFSRGGKNVMCEDYFDNMIVFADSWWIGTKEENPEESRLDFPKELIQLQKVEYDFQGGAGAEPMNKKIVNTNEAKHAEEDSSESDIEMDGSGAMDLKEVTPIRHSERTAQKKIRYVEFSSGGGSAEDDTGLSKDEEEEEEEEEEERKESEEVGISSPVRPSEKSELKPNKLSKPTVPAAKSNEASCTNPGSLVQVTLSTLFSKMQGKKSVDEKDTPKDSRKTSSSKEHRTSKRKADLADGSKKKGKVTQVEKSGSGLKAKKTVHETEEDDIEEFSSSSQDEGGSDEDWEG